MPYPAPDATILLARERRISTTLQRAIQPATSAVRNIGGLRVAVRCHGADPELGLGGDWYLVLSRANGDVTMAVGDVVGHGLAAVEAMIGLRYATAAYAAEGHSPTTILTLLNALLCRPGNETSATAVVASYRPGTGRFVWARAGHPPLLICDGRHVSRLPNPPGPLLGMFPDASYGLQTRMIRPGHSVLLYTDGMIKRGGYDEGIDLLAARIAGAGGLPSTILDRLDFGAARDDACALLAQCIA